MQSIQTLICAWLTFSIPLRQPCFEVELFNRNGPPRIYSCMGFHVYSKSIYVEKVRTIDKNAKWWWHFRLSLDQGVAEREPFISPIPIGIAGIICFFIDKIIIIFYYYLFLSCLVVNYLIVIELLLTSPVNTYFTYCNKCMLWQEQWS